MKPCTKAGVELSWRCNWSCQHCFYRRNPNLHTTTEKTYDEVCAEVLAVKERGMSHIVFIGQGEPSLYPAIQDVVSFIRAQGLTCSMITNGATGLSRFDRVYAAGLNHVHVSTHGLGGVLTQVTGDTRAHEKQEELKGWLAANGHRYRANTSMQRLNYRTLPDIAASEIGHGVYQYVMLGFLPHYEWRGHTNEVAVHPGELQPYIEQSAELLMRAGTYFTIRYHPCCYLLPKYWPYVTNARYVFFDPFEWNHTLNTSDAASLWQSAEVLGDSVACAEPCRRCAIRTHCGGWNKRCRDELSVELTPVTHVPEPYRDLAGIPGGIFDLNPANGLSGLL